MTGWALLWIAGSALLHVSWNAMLSGRRSPAGFMFQMLLSSSVFLSICLWLRWVIEGRPSWEMSTASWIALAISAPVQSLYMMFVSLAYSRGALSIVYPVSRGTAPVLIAMMAHLIWAEEISALGYAGIGLVMLGVLVLHTPGLGRRALTETWKGLLGSATWLAFGAAVMISLYHLADRQGALHARPLSYSYFLTLSTALAYGIVLASSRLLWGRAKGSNPADRAVFALEKKGWAPGLAGGLILFLAYLIILSLMHNPSVKLGYLAAARNISIVLGAAYGTLARGEGTPAARLLGAAIVFAGVAAIALAG